jgi:predicted small secreted protein
MRAFGFAVLLVVGSMLSSCSRDTRRDEPAAREVGRDAYRASQEIKRDAKKAGKDLQKAGKELREGWNEAKRDDTRPKK